MNEEKKLLYEVIEYKLNCIRSLNKDDIIVDNINLSDLLKSIITNSDNIANMTDIIIDRIANEKAQNNPVSFKRDLTQLRNQLSQKRDNKLKYELTPDQAKLVNLVVEDLTDILEKKGPHIINVEEVEKQCNDLLKKLKKKEIINNFDFIEEITKEYNNVEFDNNMLSIMKYINEHNLAILSTPKKNIQSFDVKYIRKTKIEDKKKEILNKLNIDYQTLPNYVVSEFKKSDVESIYETFQLIKQNRAEDYGILHLVKKENSLARLILIMYATPESIKGVVDSIKDEQGLIEINLLKIIINNAITSFFVKKNDYFHTRFYDYMSNILMLKKIGVNYRELIKRNPLFMITDNEILTYTLDYLEQKGLPKKAVINKCYKTLSIDASLLIKNVDILFRYNIDMQDLFQSSNYNLLKIQNLDVKLDYIIKKYNLNVNNLDLSKINKLLIAKIFHESNDEHIIWSDTND